MAKDPDTETYDLKSYGTVLRDHPLVNKTAEEFYTFKATSTDTVDINKIPKRIRPQFEGKMQQIPINDILPRSFRGHHVWANYITLPYYLGGCGDDWAMALCHCISDRFSIFSLGQINPVLFSDEILYCGNLDKPNYDPTVKSQKNLDVSNICVGYSVYEAAKYIYQNGLTEATCFNKTDLKQKYNLNPFETYTSTSKKDLPTCTEIMGDQLQHCIDSNKPRRVFRILSLINIAPDDNFFSIKYEIYRYGPVVAGFLMYKDFVENYDGISIYEGPAQGSEVLGGHTIRILGWGRDSKKNIDFWICANNWSTKWGEGGYFRMKMGIKECMLEDNVVAPIVNLAHLNYTYEPVDVLKVPQSWQNKNPPIIIRETLFTPYTTQLIREGKLSGSLDPLIYKDFTIDAPSFWAGDIDYYVKNYQDIGAPRLLRSTEVKNSTNKNIFGIVFIIIIILATLYYIFKNKKL